jgi:hypothetical protein
MEEIDTADKTSELYDCLMFTVDEEITCCVCGLVNVVEHDSMYAQ